MISRRSLFKALLGGIAAASTLDPERLLWVPGAKAISIPPTPKLAFAKDAFEVVGQGLGVLKRGDVVTISGKFAFDPITRRETNVPQYFMVTSAEPLIFQPGPRFINPAL